MNLSIPRVKLHPATCKHLKLGHPWITEDSYTKQFPLHAFFLIGVDEKSKQEVALYLHDPLHKIIKARLWSTNREEWLLDFKDVLKSRIKTALSLRDSLKKERENIFLINGESDFLPGLVVQQLKNEVIIQFYAMFWKKYENDLIEILKKEICDITKFWVQTRNTQAKKDLHVNDSVHNSSEFVIKEFGINYKIKINQHYDFGIYSDMSAIRKQMIPFLENQRSLLNLFSYTGAFSLFSLKMKFQDVFSVDLSSRYLSWLNENILLNPDLNMQAHTSLQMSCEKALAKLIFDKKKFNVIICDPPSASSDGHKFSNALKSYESLLPLMFDVLDEKSGKIFLFLNTHTVSWKKFEDKIITIIDNTRFKNKAKIKNHYKLSEDCTPLNGFQEGDYLKGVMIELKES